MAEPYQRPEAGSFPKLDRLLRDGTYLAANTIVALNDHQYDPKLHELVGQPTDPEQHAALQSKLAEHASLLETMRGDWAAMKAKLNALEETMSGMQTPATPPPSQKAPPSTKS